VAEERVNLLQITNYNLTDQGGINPLAVSKDHLISIFEFRIFIG
jgi:hypothetical protein